MSVTSLIMSIEIPCAIPTCCRSRFQTDQIAQLSLVVLTLNCIWLVCYTAIAYAIAIATASYTLGSMSSSLHSSSQGYPPTSVTKLSKLAFPSKPCTQSI